MKTNRSRERKDIHVIIELQATEKADTSMQEKEIRKMLQKMQHLPKTSYSFVKVTFRKCPQ